MIFTTLFFNSLFSSSYDECIKRAQCFRILNDQTKIILRDHAAQSIAETFEKNYLDTVEQKKSLPQKKESKKTVKKNNLKKINPEISDIKNLTQNVKAAFHIILKKNKSFNDSVLEVEKSEAYQKLTAKYPVVEKIEYKHMLHSILVRQYQSYRLSLIMKDAK